MMATMDEMTFLVLLVGVKWQSKVTMGFHRRGGTNELWA